MRDKNERTPPPWSVAGVRTLSEYRGTSLIRNSAPLGPYSGNMPRALWCSQGWELFLMSGVPHVGFRVEDVGSRVLEKGRAGRNVVDWAAKNQGLRGFGLRV